MCSLNVLDKATCLIKVVLEHGDPFPAKFIKSEPLRFLICTTLLAGLVLSNGFKSENVYNIVLPKQPLKFSAIDELLQQGYTIYSKLIDPSYYPLLFKSLVFPAGAGIRKDNMGRKELIVVSDDDFPIFSATTEVNTYDTMQWVMTNL